ncbi:MAG TPA: TSUP family transporter [Acidimicrobiales bacterium]|nr:TSUP family transporter [Acidimicrobiales bacterium]
MTVVHLAAPAVAAAMAAVAAGAVAQAVTGFGFSLVSAPVLVLLVGPLHAVRLVNILALTFNVIMLVREHTRVDLGNAARLLAPALAVAPVAAYFVHRTDQGVLSIVVGLTVLACAILLASGRRTDRLRGRGGMLAAGAASAAMNTTSGVGGPTVAMYALNAGWPLEMTRPTLQAYFLGLNLLSFIALGPVSLRPLPAVLLGAAIAGGYVAGSMGARRLSAVTVGRAIIAMAIAGGLAAVVRGLAEL